MAQIPVTVLTGYLGAGKTTLLNRILSEEHGKKYAVVVNEYGEEGIDGALVVGADEEVYEMNNGCICCTVRGDLIRVISGLMKRANAFDGILIETTGLADPAPVAQTFFADEEIAAKAKLDSVVTVVDAYHIMGQLGLASGKAAQDCPPEKEAQEQIAFADIILLNKADLVSEEDLTRITAAIHRINRYAKVIRTTRGNVPLDQILGIGSFDLDRILERDPDFLKEEEEHHHHHHHDHDHHECGPDCDHHHHHHDHDDDDDDDDEDEHEHSHHDSEISSVSVRADKPLDPARFEEWIGGLRANNGQDLLRYKGILDLVGSTNRLVVQGVHMMMDGSNLLPWREGEKRSSRMVFIGRHLDQKALREGFARCVA